MTEKLNKTTKALTWALVLFAVVFVGIALSVYAMDSLDFNGKEVLVEENGKEALIDENVGDDQPLGEDVDNEQPEEQLELKDEPAGAPKNEQGVEEPEKKPTEQREESQKEESKKQIEESKEKPEESKESGEQPGSEDDKKNNQGSGTTLKVISDGNYLLALVTKETTLKSSYAPSDLVRIPSYMNPPRELYLRSEAFEHLEDMWEDAKEQGVTLSVLSTYRSYSYQAQLFAEYAAKHGEQAANRFSARAGQSEHQLGTTIDFGSGTSADWTDAFANTKQGKWLRENAHLYGFAMSYPEGKESITGYIYEPWHFRYIGVSAAKEWKKSGLVLCEFLKTKPQYYDN